MEDEDLQEEKSFRMHDDSEADDDLLGPPDEPEFGKIPYEEEDPEDSFT